ncbi:conserved hypothetical protein [Leishmania braziliensis MHOM/BR/75/M2904]|uniref:Transmembrane adaptor Erv26 n=2 Tax=Leishmania braziliensis TaxID=5660 RepID=A4HFY1_LEIBR|nr:conserved hypothetical protein [Leishmania braziliensis MHOM/BR/75/M2904]KAI5684749.1 Transmembrane adaptor Erv26 [Leishmania braziliensis]CAJ2475428.1 unnamed protein product [Leishmania braziliensis]CAM45499.2 conserved hypothetical protein [Leishmania braziliensis MHOM/BR/75/M2904]SYZ67134.1 Transmembrane_adaptor_Erv26 [Leishmania braziliensis MHOM/BR/75/M2904]
MSRQGYHNYDDEENESWWIPPKRAYRSFGPFRVVSTLMVAVAIALIAFGLACAVMFVAEVAEEHPSRAKWTLRALIFFNVIVHVSIFIVDQMSWWRSLLSLFVNVLYLRVMRTFPFVSGVNNLLVLGTILAVLVESAMWYWYVLRLMYYTSALLIMGFFLLLWLVPIGLLSSCVMEDDRLPGGVGAGGMYSSGLSAPSVGDSPAANPMAGGRRRRTVLHRLADLVSNT